MKTWEYEGLETHPRHSENNSGVQSPKVLGIPRNVVHDYFTIDVKGLLELDTSKPVTKRIVLQSAAWDDELPPDIYATWLQWRSELPLLSELKIPRMILDSSAGDSSEIQIHTFSDASQRAYGTATFLRVKLKEESVSKLFQRTPSGGMDPRF
ncbi:reverse transcriptase domain-containing protein [Nephila pilipes]|uniref:Reverse transcriptase domain-containing protein n=1 Tax=Nephila pilipes TaxID=299642 RepID=A0A8X6NFH2_NEPPI|nr:reverse transcriptase domain-containing protein [Nephila pilipes]